MATSKVVLDASLSKTKEIVAAVQQLQKAQEDADRKASKDIKQHIEDKQRLPEVEKESVYTREAAENESKAHLLTMERLQKEELYHARSREALYSAKEDVASMRLQMDALKVEMESQRKAFVINVNWAARCTELKSKYDQSGAEYDTLFDEHIRAKSEMDMALREQEEHRMRHQEVLDTYANIQEDIRRCQDELAAKGEVSTEVQAKLDELGEFRAAAAEAAAKGKLGNHQALAVLQRSMAKGEEGLKTSAFTGWSSLTKTLKQERFHKDRAMKRAVGIIATEGMAVCAETFKEWQGEVEKVKRSELLAATKRLEDASSSSGAGSMAGRQRAIAQMEKQFKGEDFVLQQSCFQGWALGQVARKKRDQNHKKASRLIANSGLALCAEIMGRWNELTEKTRKKNRDKAANMNKAGRFIANSAKAFQGVIVTSWWGMIEDIRRDRKANEAGTAKAMRMMANSGASLMNLCFDGWGKLRGESRKKDAGNKKALRMMANSAQAMIIACWQVWSKERATRSAKNQNTAKAVRMINASSEALQASVFQSWSKDVAKDKDKNKKMRALEKSFGAQDTGRKLVVLTSWQSYAKVEGRKKRAKEFSMKSAIKSITGNSQLLLCQLTLAWARYASGDKLLKLAEATKTMEVQLQAAVEQARVAVEHDLVKAQTDVDQITGKLEGLVQEHADVQGRVADNERRLEDADGNMRDLDSKVKGITSELDQSRVRAKNIGDELSKVGIFLGAHSPPQQKTSRPSSSSRPRSGNRSAAEDKLPRLDGSNSRPRSGVKADGSKSARGVPGERGDSARSLPRGDSARGQGRPPVPQADERRYLNDGSGPYTYAEFLDIYSEKGREAAQNQWNIGDAAA